MTTDLLDQLFRLYGLATTHDVAVFEQLALRQLGQLVGFNGAVWGEGRLSAEGSLLIEKATLVDRPAKILEDYSSLPVADPVTQSFIIKPDNLQNIDVDKNYKDQRLGTVKDFLKAHDIGYLLLQGWSNNATGKLTWLTAYRSVKDRPFTPEESARLSLVLPHWIQAREICRSVSLLVPSQDTLTQPTTSSLHKLSRPNLLTDRQKEVLLFLALGMSYRQIAEQLGLSEQTVKEHASNIYSRLGVQNKAEAVFEGRALGFIR